MSMHTPGPWTWWTSNSWRRLKHDYRGHTVNVLEPTVCHDGQPDCIVSQDDMALIAAAPDMLQALKIAREYVVRVDATMAFTDAANRLTKPDLDKIDSAIAKAEGRT